MLAIITTRSCRNMLNHSFFRCSGVSLQQQPACVLLTTTRVCLLKLWRQFGAQKEPPWLTQWCCVLYKSATACAHKKCQTFFGHVRCCAAGNSVANGFTATLQPTICRIRHRPIFVKLGSRAADLKAELQPQAVGNILWVRGDITHTLLAAMHDGC
jgi:hypothetical protein